MIGVMIGVMTCSFAESLVRGLKPNMDASDVAQRNKIDEHPIVVLSIGAAKKWPILINIAK